MVDFNLHPWRKQERLRENKIIKKYMSIGILIALSIWLLTHYHFVNYKRQTLSRIKSLEKKLSQNAFKTISPTAAKQDFFIQKLVPALSFFSAYSVCFTEIKQTENAIEFYGLASSSKEFREFLLKWKAAALFSSIEIQTMERQANGLRFIFQGRREN